MFRLLYPVQGTNKAPVTFCTHSSVAYEMVARLEDVPGGAARQWCQRNGAHLRKASGMVSMRTYAAETILNSTADQETVRELKSTVF